jgi:membrane protein implicated in regulation of membrane protease activity
MAPGETGQAELRGSVWSVRNTGDEGLEKGDRAVVQEVEGLLLHVRSES